MTRNPGGVTTLFGMTPPDRLDAETADRFLRCYVPREGDVVVDAGAGIGTEVLTFSRLVGPKGRVVAIEAHPSSFDRLAALCAVNRLENVSPVHVALSDEQGEVSITDREDVDGNTIVDVRGGGMSVPADTLDRVLAGLGLLAVDFLKMNIEGAEVAALRGFHGLDSTGNVAIACHDFVADTERGSDAMRTQTAVRELLAGAGFSLEGRDEDERPWIRDYVYGRNTRRVVQADGPGRSLAEERL